ncbi:hypothetical protein SEA_JACKO_72 [Microbacterium phage Jacko]|nr:hypothetical protein SEA_JACKO_72 [Microbacterium phage Jacko]
MTAAVPGIYAKMLKIQQEIEVEKTGWDERNEYAYWKADDVAAATRRVMNKVGVIHRVNIIDFDDKSRVDAQGRERRRLLTRSEIIFIDPEDGSQMSHEVIATGSDIGGDKDTRKVAVQAFKIAAVDLFMIAEGMGALDSDGAAEAEPEDLTQKPAEEATKAKLTVRDLNKEIGRIVKDEANGVTAADVKKAGDALAKKVGLEENSVVWKKESAVMEPLVEALEKAIAAVADGAVEDLQEAIELALAGDTGEVD